MDNMQDWLNGFYELNPDAAEIEEDVKVPKKYELDLFKVVLPAADRCDKNFYKNHPTTEHFIPLLLAFGSAFNKKGESFNSEILYSNISLESFIFDKKEA